MQQKEVDLRMSNPISEEDMRKILKEVLDKPLKLVEAGGAMDNDDAKRVLRFGVKSNTVEALLGKLASYIDWSA